MKCLLLRSKTISLASLEPTPPTGSDYDQSTLDNAADIGYIVAGEVGGDPVAESYWSQEFINDRAELTGFGAVIGLQGDVSKKMYVLISDSLQNPNDEDSVFITGGLLEPGEFTPGEYYYCYFTLETPVPLIPGKKYYMTACTDEPFVEDPTTGWIWAGMSTDVYTTGSFNSFNGQNWTAATGDTLFFTWTKTITPPPNCEDYTNVTDCVNAGCYWWSDGTCHSTQENGEEACEDFETETSCLTAGCYWYKKYLWEDEKCHGKEQNMMMDYMPFILIGSAGVLLLVALATKTTPSPQYMPVYYPPKQNNKS